MVHKSLVILVQNTLSKDYEDLFISLLKKTKQNPGRPPISLMSLPNYAKNALKNHALRKHVMIR